jgi:cytidine deaminase
VAYPSGICAERTVLFYAQSKFPKASVKAIAVTALFNGTALNEPVTPCGACRQVMSEYEARHGEMMKIIMASDSGKVYITHGIESLMPLLFKADNLRKKK